MFMNHGLTCQIKLLSTLLPPTTPNMKPENVSLLRNLLGVNCVIFRFQGLVFSGRIEKNACFTYTLIIMYSTSAGSRKYLDETGKMLELQPILELRGAFFESQNVICGLSTWKIIVHWGERQATQVCR